jgi:phage terminase Nu1 subunit (DNA packaging protein)
MNGVQQAGQECYVDKRGASEITGIRVTTLDKWASMGKGPAWRKFGRLRRYCVADLISWMSVQPKFGGGEVLARVEAA